MDDLAENAKQASVQVRADMREARAHAVKMRQMAIDQVKHSIQELELSMSTHTLHDLEWSSTDKEKNIHMLDSLNLSLSELEGVGFKSRRGSNFNGDSSGGGSGSQSRNDGESNLDVNR